MFANLFEIYDKGQPRRIVLPKHLFGEALFSSSASATFCRCIHTGLLMNVIRLVEPLSLSLEGSPNSYPASRPCITILGSVPWGNRFHPIQLQSTQAVLAHEDLGEPPEASRGSQWNQRTGHIQDHPPSDCRYALRLWEPPHVLAGARSTHASCIQWLLLGYLTWVLCMTLHQLGSDNTAL